MASRAYNQGIYQIINRSINFASDTIKVMLVKSTYTFNADHDSLSDVSGEVTVSGYARQTLANKTITLDDTNDRVKIDGDDPSFASLAAGETAVAAIVYKDTGLASTDIPIVYIDITDTATNGGTIVVNFHADGIFYFSI